MHYPTDRITHTTAFTPVVEHWLELEEMHIYTNTDILKSKLQNHIRSHKAYLHRENLKGYL